MYVDIKPICYECVHCRFVGLTMVGRPSEGGGEEDAYACDERADMDRYSVSHGCDTKNQCALFSD